MSTRPIGIYNYANSYRHAALSLRAGKAPGTHPDAPILFLINHAIELYLKSFLHARRIPEAELSRKPYGHELLNLAWAAKQRGLCPTERTYAVIRMLDAYNTKITSRYIQPRVYRPILDEALDAAAIEIHQKVGVELCRLGFSVRIGRD